MSKKSAKIAATYFITIICSLVLIGGIGYYLITSYLNGSGEKKESEMERIAASDRVSGGEYVPEQGDGRTLLFIYDPEKRQTAVCFVLARFAPAENKAVIVPLQTDIACELDGKANTLYEFYRLGGTAAAKRAAEKATGLTVDRYIKFSKESFVTFSNFMGNVDYDVPYNLVFENPDTGEKTIMKGGSQILDATSLRKVLTFPNYDGGEEYRAKVVGNLASSLLNSGARGLLRDSLETVFTDVINSDIETDITRYDYEEDKPAIEYVLENTSSPAQLVIPSGSYNENNCYILDESFIEALPRWFSMNV